MTTHLHARIEQALEIVKIQVPEWWRPRTGIVLGSGLGALADDVEPLAAIPYEAIPGFSRSSVEGHTGRLVLGNLDGVPVAVMQGRFHYYEGYDLQHVTFPIRVLHAMGADTLVLTNAAGGLNPDFVAGDLMLITDHINMLGWGGQNPLIGPNDPELGPRFPSMTLAYDPGLRALALEAAAECNLTLRQGVYIVLAGPTYETPAELRLLRQWGADAVGMSTVPEVIVARHEGMRVVGISTITNMALGNDEEQVDHNDVLAMADRSRPQFIRLIKTLVTKINESDDAGAQQKRRT